MMNKYQIFIPSYDRAEILENTTLKILKKFNISPVSITIFVETREMANEYNKKFNYQYQIIVSNTKGIQEKRQFIHYYAKERAIFLNSVLPILFMDDDLEELVFDNNEKINFDDFIKTAFIITKNSNLNIWGVAPYSNHFFLREGITKDLKYICGALYGEIISPNTILIERDINHGEDLQFSMEGFLRDGGLIRFNNIGFKTKYFPDSGITKLCGGKKARQKEMEINCKYLANRYGDMCSLKLNKYGYTVQLNKNFKN